jgi:hypothetical protein
VHCGWSFRPCWSPTTSSSKRHARSQRMLCRARLPRLPLQAADQLLTTVQLFYSGTSGGAGGSSRDGAVRAALIFCAAAEYQASFWKFSLRGRGGATLWVAADPPLAAFGRTRFLLGIPASLVEHGGQGNGIMPPQARPSSDCLKQMPENRRPRSRLARAEAAGVPLGTPGSDPFIIVLGAAGHVLWRLTAAHLGSCLITEQEAEEIVAGSRLLHAEHWT